jgi:hypothetical protein
MKMHGPGNIKFVKTAQHVSGTVAQKFPKHVDRCLRDKAIDIRLIVHVVGCFIEYLKMYGTTNPKKRRFAIDYERFYI